MAPRGRPHLGSPTSMATGTNLETVCFALCPRRRSGQRLHPTMRSLSSNNFQPYPHGGAMSYLAMATPCSESSVSSLRADIGLGSFPAPAAVAGVLQIQWGFARHRVESQGRRSTYPRHSFHQQRGCSQLAQRRSLHTARASLFEGVPFPPKPGEWPSAGDSDLVIGQKVDRSLRQTA